MSIPAAFHGSWRGQIEDTQRVNPYFGEIVIDGSQVRTLYEMRRGDVRSRLSVTSMSEESVVLDEEVGSFRGTLHLTRDSRGRLRCEWRQGKQNVTTATALMTAF